MSREYTKEELWDQATIQWKYTLSRDKKKFSKDLKSYYSFVVKRVTRGWAFLDAPRPDFDNMEKMLEGWRPPSSIS